MVTNGLLLIYKVMKWIKERSSLAFTGGMLGIIICTLCVIFTSVIPAVLISLLSVGSVGLLQEARVYHSSQAYEFDWYNVLATVVGGCIAIAFVICFAII